MPVIDVVATGRNIKRLRLAAGYTVRDLQAVLGFTNPQAIYKWQNGDSLPSIDNLVILGVVFGVTIDKILVVEGASAGSGKSAQAGSAVKGINVQW